jgi:hypothetical protein
MHQKEARQRESHEEQGDDREARSVARDDVAEANREERAEIAQPDADAADAAAILRCRHVRQQRVVELQARLIEHVGQDEQRAGQRQRSAGDERREQTAANRAPDQERHAAARAIRHGAEHRRHDQNDCH